MIGKGATPSFFSIANYNYTLTAQSFKEKVYKITKKSSEKHL